MNIPIFRAKKIDSNDYVKGYLLDKNTILTTSYYYVQGMPPEVEEYFNNIDPTTLAIYFPDSINTSSEKVWYNLEEISNIIKEYNNEKTI